MSMPLLTSCGCDHYFTQVSDTATCESSGTKTYKCEYCSETKKEHSEAKGHDFQEISDTSTCTNDGVVTYKCLKCNKNKTEAKKATGHNYGYNDKCTKCDEYKYKLTWSQTEKSGGQALYVSFSSTSSSIYAEIGIVFSERASTAWLLWQLYDSKDNKIASDMPAFRWSSFCEFSTRVCDKSLLNVNETYKFVIYNIGVL